METRPSDGYLRAFTRLGDLVLEGRFDAALVEARRMRTEFPGWASSVARTEACLHWGGMAPALLDRLGKSIAS